MYKDVKDFLDCNFDKKTYKNLFYEFNNFILRTAYSNYHKIPLHKRKSYINSIEKILSVDDYNIFLKKIHEDISTIKILFSIKTTKYNSKRYIIISILGKQLLIGKQYIPNIILAFYRSSCFFRKLIYKKDI